MTLARHPFPGWAPFVDAAAADMGVCATIASDAKTLKQLTQISGLLGYAVTHDNEKAADILKECDRLRDVLHVALEAADAMITDVRRGLDLDLDPPRLSPVTTDTAFADPDDSDEPPTHSITSGDSAQVDDLVEPHHPE
jgi:hypothetical protein